MADRIELKAELRTDVGKGASRRLRRLEDLVPAIVYGAGRDALAVSVPHKDLHKALEDEGFYSRIVTIHIGRDRDQVILKALQRHPAKDRILHADFLRVSMDQAITVRVPLHFIHEDTCIGVKNQGGVISHIETEIEISCLPGSLPEFIEVDMATLEVGDSIHQSNLVLPEGVEIAGTHQADDADPTIVSVHAPKGGAGAEGAEGEETGGTETPATRVEGPEGSGEEDK
jgi:large subunit ribosomal protein L25